MTKFLNVLFFLSTKLHFQFLTICFNAMDIYPSFFKKNITTNWVKTVTLPCRLYDVSSTWGLNRKIRIKGTVTVRTNKLLGTRAFAALMKLKHRTFDPSMVLYRLNLCIYPLMAIILIICLSLQKITVRISLQCIC